MSLNCKVWVNYVTERQCGWHCHIFYAAEKGKYFLKNIPGLKAFALFVVKGNDEHIKPSSKESIWVKFKDSICAELCLKHGLKSICLEAKCQTITS